MYAPVSASSTVGLNIPVAATITMHAPTYPTGPAPNNYAQQKIVGIPVLVNPTVMSNTMGDVKLDMKMVVGADEVILQKNKNG